MYALLCSLPGTPVLYYGDEIGMGDNVYLGDRDSVPHADAVERRSQRRLLGGEPATALPPAIIDPEYSYESVNVAANSTTPTRCSGGFGAGRAAPPQSVFAHGTIEILSPDNHRVLAFLRRDEDRQVLVVANLSRYAQYVELDLHEFRGAHPVE